MFVEQSIPQPASEPKEAAVPCTRPCGHSRRRTVVLTLLSIAVLHGDLGRAEAHEASASSVEGGDNGRSRATWAALLLGYVAVGSLATGAAYLLRDNLVGRGVAVTSAGWGGFGVGAVAGYGLVHLHGCGSADCATEEQVAVSAGAVLGAVAATIAGHFLTSDPGMSRPYTTAAGLAPALAFLITGTIADW
jgi:hypothetical protein